MACTDKEEKDPSAFSVINQRHLGKSIVDSGSHIRGRATHKTQLSEAWLHPLIDPLYGRCTPLVRELGISCLTLLPHPAFFNGVWQIEEERKEGR